jgi:hypothetical protein
LHECPQAIAEQPSLRSIRLPESLRVAAVYGVVAGMTRRRPPGRLRRF